MQGASVIKIYEADSKQGMQLLSALESRRLEFPPELVEQVRGIIEEVRSRGDDALCDYTRRFDCPEFSISDIEVSDEEVDRAFAQVNRDVLESLEKARRNIESFHRSQMPRSWFDTRADGTIVGQRVAPVRAAGLYVPGGKSGQTPLVSSVLMNAIPAKVAGVERIILCTPPGHDATVSPYLLVAARLAGVDRIYRAGSAWAIAAMAHGTKLIQPVDVIAGPGNIFVTIAKKLIAGSTGIDMIAGPSEILVIADESANPAFVAADMLSQAEHDEMATSILLTISRSHADQVSMELESQLGRLSRSEIAERSLRDRGFILVVKDLEQACKVADMVAPEHLELMVQDPWSLVPMIRNAGAIFIGEYTPEPIGDYIAGTNHVLPTMGTARFSSALGVDTFLKRSSIVFYSKRAFLQDAKDVMSLAEIEGLGAHRRSVAIRLD